MDIRWVLLKSWHALRPHDHSEPTTYCGRPLVGTEQVSDALPSGKSCEVCLRIVSRLQDDAKAVE
jgi:hypothetical protein